MKTKLLFLSLFYVLVGAACGKDSAPDGDNQPASTVKTYPIAGTGQTTFYNNSGIIPAPAAGEAFYGQNAQYPGSAPSYTDNGDGTVTDNVTGLMWQASADLDGDGAITVGDKLTYENAITGAAVSMVGGYNDWRLPTIKELYSLILFSGRDLNPNLTSGTDGLTPFIDTTYFKFAYGDLSANERLIDAQYVSSNVYVSPGMSGETLVFGVNFADGRIKGYGLRMMGGKKTFNVKYVRGTSGYGVNKFTDNQDGTITDEATGLMWQQADNGLGMNWQEALAYAENAELAGYTDWRLPDAKELQSIVDYSRSPSSTNSAAIDPLFFCTQITNEAGVPDYPFYWTSTTHASMMIGSEGGAAAYVSFGRALGYMGSWMDVHGAGAQRSDPKAGDPDLFPYGRGPQGDAIRIYNQVRLVRNAE